MKRLAVAPILAALPLTLLLSACKPSSPPAPAPTAAAQPPTPPAATSLAPPSTPADPRPLILCFGDSLTAGYGTGPGESYPDQLQLLLDHDHLPFRVLNDGISGNTTKDALERLPRVLAHHPALVVLEFGGNDGLRGLPIEQTQSNLDAILAQLRHAHIPVALAGITLPPDYGPVYIHRFDAIYPALARKYHLRLLPFLLTHVYGVPGDMQPDATHATAQGNQQVARNVLQLIRPLLPAR